MIVVFGIFIILIIILFVYMGFQSFLHAYGYLKRCFIKERIVPNDPERFPDCYYDWNIEKIYFSAFVFPFVTLLIVCAALCDMGN